MANVIKLKKGLDIPLEGKPVKEIVDAPRSEYYALIPDDFHGVIPKVIVKAGDHVDAGTPLMYDKNRPEVKFVSPVSGEVVAVNRGERRKVLDITIKSDNEQTYVKLSLVDGKLVRSGSLVPSRTIVVEKNTYSQCRIISIY